MATHGGGGRRADRARPAPSRATLAAAAALTAAVAVNAAGNLLFQALVARGGGVRTYGAVGALLSFGTVASTVAAGVQYAVARVASLTDEAPPALLRRGVWAASPWLGLTALTALLCIPTALYLHLAGPLPVVTALAYVAALLAYALPSGVLVGRGRFGAFALLTVLSAAVRPAYGALLGWSSPDGTAALASSLLTVVTVGVVAVVLLLRTPLGRARTAPAGDAVAGTRSALGGDSARGGALAAMLWVVWTLPLLLGRHHLGADAAGNLAAVHLLVSGLLFLAAPVTTVLYPLIARHRRRRDVVAGLVATAAVCLGGAVAASVAGPPLVHRLYGGQFAAPASLFLLLGASMTAVALATYALWAAQALARGVTPVAAAVTTALAVETVLGSLWHSGAAALAAGPLVALAAGGCVAAVASTASLRRVPGGAVAFAHPSPPPPPAGVAGGLLRQTAVGVMVHNEAPTLEACLRAVLDERDGDDRVGRVVVVASGCSDGSVEVARRVAAGDARVTVLVEAARRGKAAAVNWFLAETAEPICVLAGGDTLPAPGSLARLVGALHGGNAVMAGPRVVPTNGGRGLCSAVVREVWALHHEVARRRPKCGEVVAFRRVVDAIDTSTLTDEVSLEARVRAGGGALRYVSDAIVFNHGPSRLRDHLAHRTRIHRGHLGERAASGYAPATMDAALLVRAAVGRAVCRPQGIAALVAAVVLELVARGRARVHRQTDVAPPTGVWSPVRSAKRAFRVELPVTGVAVARARVEPVPEEVG